MASMSTNNIFENILAQATLGQTLILATGLVVITYRRTIYLPINKLLSPLRRLPGPKLESWILGNLYAIVEEKDGMVLDRWAEEHGTTFAYRRFFGSYSLCTLDPRAMSFIMSHNMMFPKAEQFRKAAAMLLGEGILSADEETHRRQCRIMNPSFNTAHIRNLMPVFWEKSNQLRDVWFEIIRDNPDGVELEVLSWLTRATLDIIGVAGFGYEFRSIEDEDEDQLAKAFTQVFNSNQEFTKLSMLKYVIWALLRIPTEERKRFKANLATIRRIGMGLVNDKKALFQGSMDDKIEGRDLLTLLIKSNISPDVDKSQALTDEEVFGQISTFLATGHETTSSSTTWALYVLAKYPDVQRKLRHEVQTSGLGATPTMDELDKLSYLNNFLREALRLYGVVPMTAREAGCDTVIPLQKDFTDVHGVVHSEIRVQKGDSITIPIMAMNRAKEVWGEHAMEFKPERWDDLPTAVKEMPGVWSHLMTFLHGPRACIGYRFAVVEMKVLLYALVTRFEFEINPSIEIEGKTGLVTRPRVKGDSEKRNRMPLLCKLVAKP